MKVGFVFTNYNNSQLTINAIESIYKIDGDFQKYIVIIDNSSEDAEKEILSSYNFDERTRIHFNDINLGYFNGLNLGLQLIKELSDELEFVVIGNNDLIFPEDFMHNINNKKSILNKYPVISPNIITLDGIHQNPHVIKGVSKFRNLIYDIYYINYYISIIIKKIASISFNITDRDDENFHDLSQEIVQGYGACYILTSKFFNEFGLLWAPTFIMGEEYFLSLQLNKKGYKFFYESSIIVRHQCHATMGKLQSKYMWQLASKAHKVYRKYGYNDEILNN